MADIKQYATFTLGDMFLGVDVTQVQEVIRFQPMTRVPRALAMIHGLINLRGQIVVAIDLRHRFGLPALAAGNLPMNVVVRTEDGPASLLVDDIGDVVDVQEDTFESIPETLDGAARDLITGVYKLNARLLLILNTERAVSLPASSAKSLLSTA